MSAKKKVKEVKAWALMFVECESLFPIGIPPQLFDTKADALTCAKNNTFREHDELHAEPVRVTIRIES